MSHKETKWIQYDRYQPDPIPCPIPDLKGHHLNPNTMGWRQGKDKYKHDEVRSKKRRKIGNESLEDSTLVTEASNSLRPASVAPSTSFDAQSTPREIPVAASVPSPLPLAAQESSVDLLSETAAPPPSSSATREPSNVPSVNEIMLSVTERSSETLMPDLDVASKAPFTLNPWVLDLKNTIDSPLRPPETLYVKILDIFGEIQRFGKPIPFYRHQHPGPQLQNVRFTPPLKTKRSFSLRMVMRDLYDNYHRGLDINIISSETGYEDREVSVMEFLANNFFTDGTGTFQGRSFACLNVFSMKKGTGEMGIDWGSRIGEASRVLGSDEASTSITPYGHITGAHTDPWCGSLVIHHLAGKKLWLTWPPTRENLTVFRTLGADDTYSDFSVWLSQLTGLEVFLMDTPESSFIMRPFTIHMCVSLSTGCHIAQPMVHGGCFDDLLTATNVMRNVDVANAHGTVVKHFSTFTRVFLAHGKEEWTKFSARKNSGTKTKVAAWVKTVEDWYEKKQEWIKPFADK
ncbi:hypothetical protein AAF712_008561 [Marasmius tenuissimus]|uniref:JmjC domain-containing protein n=1 Tax=Marasmius tenuissimus TaxID=585030 RepID=A0ABR2ZUQ4_9AGAR